MGLPSRELGGRSVDDELAATPLWDPKGHKGFFARVWSGENHEHFGTFPLAKGQETVEFVKQEIPAARIIVIFHQGALGIPVLVDRWADSM